MTLSDSIPLPAPEALKAQARRLRADLARHGLALSHAQCLETLAHQWGLRDWNTLSARAAAQPPAAPAHGWHPGQKVRGRYLGHAFTGSVKSAGQRGGGHWALTLRFDAAIDVAASTQMQNLRQQINAVVGPNGRSAQKTSDGTPHLALEPA